MIFQPARFVYQRVTSKWVMGSYHFFFKWPKVLQLVFLPPPPKKKTKTKRLSYKKTSMEITGVLGPTLLWCDICCFWGWPRLPRKLGHERVIMGPQVWRKMFFRTLGDVFFVCNGWTLDNWKLPLYIHAYLGTSMSYQNLDSKTLVRSTPKHDFVTVCQRSPDVWISTARPTPSVFGKRVTTH